MKHLIALLLASLFVQAVWAAEPVDINRASAEEIADTLDGVGMSKAQAIVRYREENGAFGHADELVNVKGIGLKTVDMNRDRIQLGGGKPSSD